MSGKITVTVTAPCKLGSMVAMPGDQIEVDGPGAALLRAAGVIADAVPGPDAGGGAPVNPPEPPVPTPGDARASAPKKGAATKG